MFIRSSLVLAALALPLVAQDNKTDASAAFYKAYFMDREQAQSAEATEKAITLYKEFIAANASHELAGKAASRCMILLYSTGDFDKARAFAKTHAGLIDKVEAAEASNRPEGNAEVAQKLMTAWRAAREDGDNKESARLMAAMQRAGSGFGRGMFGRGGQQGGRGGFGGGQRGAGRGGRGNRGPNLDIKIVDMKPEDAKKAVASLVQTAERQIDRMAQSGQADKADALEAKLDKLQDLVDDGKLKEGQVIIDELIKEMGNAGGRRGGGRGQGGRRRGGNEGGAEGGNRRRRGGAEGGAEGGARRRGGEEKIK